MVRRRFRSGEASVHIDMSMVAEVCVAVSMNGYRSLLEAYFADDAQITGKLLKALDHMALAELKVLAQAVKVAAGNLGLQAVAQVAGRVESSGADFNPTECKEAAIQLRELTETAHALCVRMGLCQTPLAKLPPLT